MQKRLQRKKKKTNINHPLSRYLEISNYPAVWVIPDIHSCYHTLHRLLQIVPNKKESLFIFLGDYINKGKYPVETLNLLIDFAANQESVFLRGNHDQMLLDAWELTDPIFKNQIQTLHSSQLLSLKDDYLSFFEETIHFLETEDFFFVHAGFDFAQADPFKDVERMMMIREITYESSKAKGKTLIRGHFPIIFKEIEKQIEHNEKVITLDNGCVYPKRQGMGRLLALELNSHRLLHVVNED